jgi:APA family basic amino acid/polyamine antiporter
MTNTKNGKISAYTGAAIVIANMIGAGVFTSLGFQLVDLGNTATIFTLWLLGGLLALSGAFSYAEIGTQIRKSGGEYAFLSDIYHPLIGYLSGWLSVTVGFTAPIVLTVIALLSYFPVQALNTPVSGIILMALVTLVHSFSIRSSSRFQLFTTSLKVILIVFFILAGLFIPAGENAINFDTSFKLELLSPAFAVALIYVSYSYSGWNAAAYITEEFRNPRKDLSRALIYGTLAVTVMYVLLQYVFLRHVPLEQLKGQLDVGAITAKKIFSDTIARSFNATISVFLISGVSAMVWAGSRVTAKMAEDHPLWRFFRSNRNGIPLRALWLQFAISTLILLTGTFEQIMIYCGLLLTLSSTMVVAGVFILRYKNRGKPKDGFQSPAFPLFQLLFIALSVWIIAFALKTNPVETLIGLCILAAGAITYLVNKSLTRGFVKKIWGR